MLDHSDIAKACLEYLSATILNDPSIIKYETATAQPQTSSVPFRENHLLNYAVKYWPEHYDRTGPDNDLDQQILSLLKNPHIKRTWYELYWLSRSQLRRQVDHEVTALQIASELGLTRIVIHLVEENADFEYDCEKFEKPLDLAVNNGHSKIIDYFLDAGAKGISALHHAAHRNDVNLIKRLVERGSSIETEFGGASPLHTSARAGCLEATRALQDFGANVSKSDASKRLALHQAAIGGHLEIVELLLRADVNATDAMGRTPLTFSAMLGHVDIARYLICSGAAVNIVDGTKRTPLHYAVREWHVDIVALLVENSADTTATDKDGCTALDAAAERGILESVRLLTRGLDSGSIFENSTALHHAIKRGHLAVVQQLVESGFSCEARDSKGRIPLYIAAETGHAKIVEFLVPRSADKSARDESGHSPLQLAASTGHLLALKALVCGGILPVDGPALHTAAGKGQYLVVKYLLGCGTPPDYGITGGQTSLAVAASNGHLGSVKALLKAGAHIYSSRRRGLTPLYFAATRGHFRVVSELIEAGANVNTRTSRGRTLLHNSVSHPEVVKMLLEADVDLNTADNYEKTAIHMAAQEGSPDTVRLLLERGADANAQDEDGFTPLHTASQRGHVPIMRMLSDHGAALDRVSNSGSSPLHLATYHRQIDAISYLVKSGAATDVTDHDGKTPLHYAASEGHRDVVEVLLKTSADFNAQDSGLRTSIHIAAYERHLEAVKALAEKGADLQILDEDGWSPLHAAADSVDVAEYLINHGAQVNEAEKNGNTPLILAALWCQESVSVVEALLNHRAAVNQGNERGETALHCAAQNGNEQLTKILLKAGALVDQEDAEGMTELHVATKRGYVKVVQTLIYHGAKIDKRDRKLRSCLTMATSSGNVEVAELFMDSETDVQAWNAQGWIDSFLAAVRHGSHDMMECLAKVDNNVLNSRSQDGFGVLRLAVEVRSETLWQKFKVLMPSACKIEDSDLWTLDQILHQSNNPFANQKANKRNNTTLRKSTHISQALILPPSLARRGPAVARVEIASDGLEIVYQSMLV